MDISHIYNPENQPKEDLIQGFIIRTNEFKNIMNDIRTDKMAHPPQHYIIQGQRGTGKSTLIFRIYYELKNDKNLNTWLLPVKFSEEQYNVRRLFKLWEEFAKYLEDESDFFYGLVEEIDKLDFLNENKFEENAYELISERILASKKKIVLLIDNIGLLFKKFNKRDQQRLREILLTNNNIRIIGASAYIMEAMEDYIKPFFEFFKVVNLKEITSEETNKLLLTLDERYKTGTIQKIIDKQPGRIEALRRIAGGIPRTIILLYEIFIDNENGNSVKDLEVVLDRVTPLYKHRMEEIPDQQQEIAHILAQNWDAMNVADIAKIAKMESRAVSSQLKQMEKNGFVTKIPTTTKNHLYRISERFFNIWFLMRLGNRKERDKVKWLIKFLEIWCDPEDLIQRTRKHIASMQNETGKMNKKYAYFFSEALAAMPISPGLQVELITNTKSYLSKSKSSFVNELSESDNYLRKKIQESDIEQGDEKSAFKKLLEIKQKSGDDFNNIGILYHIKFKDFKKAEVYFLLAIENGNSDALNNLALLYEHVFKDFKKAEKYYLMAIEKGHSEAMNNLAWYYFQKIKNKNKSLELAKNAFFKEKSIYYAHTYSLILLWMDDIQKALEISTYFIDNEKSYTDFPDEIALFIMLLMAKKQTATVAKIFKANKFDIKDRIKPVYYACMSLMQDEFPNEFRKMGPEIKSSVDEIIEKIKQMEVDYA